MVSYADTSQKALTSIDKDAKQHSDPQAGDPTIRANSDYELAKTTILAEGPRVLADGAVIAAPLPLSDCFCDTEAGGPKNIFGP